VVVATSAARATDMPEAAANKAPAETSVAASTLRIDFMFIAPIR
jgi:hypothetical protein